MKRPNCFGHHELCDKCAECDWCAACIRRTVAAMNEQLAGDDHPLPDFELDKESREDYE